MKNIKQRPVKTAGYDFSKQAARRAKRKTEAEKRAAGGVQQPYGLRQRIALADTPEKVKVVLSASVNRPGASAKTRRQWSATAKRRIEQLTNKTNKTNK